MYCENNSAFEKNFLRALPGLRTFSECDSTNASHGTGMWLNIVKGNEEYCIALGLIGECLQIENYLFIIFLSDMIKSIVDIVRLTAGANHSNMSYDMLYNMLKMGCWEGLNMI